MPRVCVEGLSKLNCGQVVQLESPEGSPQMGRRLRALGARGAYRGLPDDSSADSPHSTPVHARKAPAKKKRKPLDWRSKGAYRPVANDAHSSDEPAAVEALQVSAIQKNRKHNQCPKSLV